MAMLAGLHSNCGSIDCSSYCPPIQAQVCAGVACTACPTWPVAQQSLGMQASPLACRGLLGGSRSTAAIRRRSSLFGLRSRSITPRVMLRASFAAFSSAGFSQPTWNNTEQVPPGIPGVTAADNTTADVFISHVRMAVLSVPGMQHQACQSHLPHCPLHRTCWGYYLWIKEPGHVCSTRTAC